jgi:PAS domain S-box-containing protein
MQAEARNPVIAPLMLAANPLRSYVISMRLSVRTRLMLLVLGVALPLAAIPVLILFLLTSSQREVQHGNLLVSTRVVAALIDSELETYISLGYTLSRSPSLVRDDFEEFYTFAKNSASRWPASSVIFATADGKQVFDTEYPFGQALPEVTDRAFFDKAIQTSEMQISDLYQLEATNKYVVSIYVPVTPEGRSTHCIVVTVDVKTFDRLLQKQKLPSGWHSAVIDGKGLMIARNPSHDRFVGRPSHGKWKDLARTTSETSFEGVSLEGVPNYSTLVNSNLTNWSSSVAAAKDVMMAPFRTSLGILLAASLCAVSISIFLALFLSEKIRTPLKQLEKFALGQENKPFKLTGLPEVDSALTALKSASRHIALRDEEQRKYLAALRESETRLRQFGEASQDVLWIRDAKTLDWTYLTPAFETIYGARREEALAGDNFRNWTQLILPEDRDQAVANIERVRAGERVTFEYRIRRPVDGEVRWLRNTDFPICDDAGRVERIGGIGQDVTDLKANAGRMEIMVGELQHRTRNLIAVVRAIAAQTMATTGPTEAFRDEFNHRLEALGRVQGLLSRADQEPITIKSLVQIELDALGAKEMPDRIHLDGPVVRIRHSVVQTFALALHELATNARKHGALSSDKGGLKVTWRTYSDHKTQRLHLEWRETGGNGSGHEAKAAGGYGRELIERALPYSLNAKTSFELDENGLRCSIDMPLDRGGTQRRGS